MGLRHTRRYALTGERFDAAEALRIGLVHEVVPAEQMEAKLAEVLDAVFLSGPGAIAMTKRSFLGANGLLLDERADGDAGARKLDAAVFRRKATRARRRSAKSASRAGTARRLGNGFAPRRKGTSCVMAGLGPMSVRIPQPRPILLPSP